MKRKSRGQWSNENKLFCKHRLQSVAEEKGMSMVFRGAHRGELKALQMSCHLLSCAAVRKQKQNYFNDMPRVHFDTSQLAQPYLVVSTPSALNPWQCYFLCIHFSISVKEIISWCHTVPGKSSHCISLQQMDSEPTDSDEACRMQVLCYSRTCSSEKEEQRASYGGSASAHGLLFSAPDVQSCSFIILPKASMLE